MSYAPLVILPPAVAIACPRQWPRWALMWSVAAAIFAGCKWLTWREAIRRNGGALLRQGWRAGQLGEREPAEPGAGLQQELAPLPIDLFSEI